MKNLTLFCVLFFGLYSCQNDPGIPMCHDPNAEFAAFANDRDFRQAHPAPKPVAVTHGGEDIEFPVSGGPNGRGYLVKSHTPTDKYLLLFHEWWGLNNYIRNEAAMWSSELNLNVLAVDLYDGKLAATPDEAGKLMQACNAARASAIIKGAVQYAGADADFRTMGWCFGGGWSLQAALLLQDKATACVMYYGMPEKDVEKLKTLSCEVLMIHAKKDQWINDEVVQQFKTNMETAGKKLTVREYDADHAFANPSGQRYNEQAAQEARTVVMDFLKSR